MTVSPSIPATVHMRRSRLLGLVAVVAVAAAAVTWGAFAATESSGTSARPATQPAAVNQAGQYGRGLSRIGVYFRSTENPDLQLAPSEKRYAQGISSLSRVEQAAAFGAHGGVIDALGLNPREAAYVKAIVSLTPAQMTGAFGTGR